MIENCIWYDKDLRYDANEAELVKLIKDDITAKYNSLVKFRNDTRRYEKIINFKTSTPIEGTMENSNNSISDIDYLRDIENSPYLTFNIIKSCVETITNKIASITPKINFVTRDAPRLMQETAKKLEQWSLKLFKRGNVWSEGAKTFQCACLTGIGVMKVHLRKKDKEKKMFSFFNMWSNSDKSIEFWNVPILDFFCDNAYYGANLPSMAGEIKKFLLYDIIEMYPQKKKELIKEHGENLKLKLSVYEAFKKNKRHVVCTDKVLLVDEEWDKDIPYVIFNWIKSPQGVLGVGLAKTLYPIHQTITYILAKTLSAIENVSTPTIFVDKNTEPILKESDNVAGRIIGIDQGDQEPMVKYTTPQPISEQVLQILDRLWQRGFEMIGVNQLASAGSIPQELAGASGVAIRSYEAVQTNRFQLVRNEYENFYINILKKALDMSDKDTMPENIDKNDILKLLEYANAFSASLLPETPAGRLAAVSEYSNALPQVITPDRALSLLQSPDTDRFISSETARIHAIQIRIEDSLKKGQKPVYYASLGLDTYLEETRKFAAMTLKEDIDDNKNIERVRLLEIFIKELEKMKEQRDGALVIDQTPKSPQQPVPERKPMPLAPVG